MSWQRERGSVGLRYSARSAVVECVIARQKICLAPRGGVVARYNLTVSASREEIVRREFVLKSYKSTVPLSRLDTHVAEW